MDDDLRAEFLIECAENLETLDSDLLALEQSPDSKELVDAAFRAMHSIKGAASFMEVAALEKTAHAAETLLASIRDGAVPANDERVSALLASNDQVRGILDRLGNDEAIGGEGDAALLARLFKLVKPDPEGSPSAVASAAASAANAAKPRGAAKSRERPQASVRVDVSLLDDLMNLVGELVVCRNQILRVSESDVSEELSNSIRGLDLLTSNIQERVMKTRMRPVGSAWGRLPRLVRDLAHSCEKECALEMKGGEVELDRSILERLKDPLSHILRNAIDHGLESPAGRRSAGKPAEGRLLLRAGHVAGQVYIELSDDGKGLNTERIREKAVERGLISAEDAVEMREEEVHQLIFEPGFSTNNEVTRMSGRGVGMDVVRSDLTQVGGSVDVRSVVGGGTTIRLKIPLTLAIIPALIVSCGARRFAIPQSNLVELVDIGGRNRSQSIFNLGGAPALRRHGQIVPLLYLGRELGLDGGGATGEYVVVVHADALTYGLMVDAVHDTEEIVVKPLGKELSQIDAFSGATVRGDGSIALILDILNLAHLAHHEGRVEEEVNAQVDDVETLALLKVEVDGIGPTALPLAQVIRIEDVPLSALTRQSSAIYYEHEGRVVSVHDLVPKPRAENSRVSLILCQTRNGCMALAVSNVHEVTDATLDITLGAGPHWAKGMAMLDGRVTTILDMEKVA